MKKSDTKAQLKLSQKAYLGYIDGLNTALQYLTAHKEACMHALAMIDAKLMPAKKVAKKAKKAAKKGKK